MKMMKSATGRTESPLDMIMMNHGDDDDEVYHCTNLIARRKDGDDMIIAWNDSKHVFTRERMLQFSKFTSLIIQLILYDFIDSPTILFQR